MLELTYLDKHSSFPSPQQALEEPNGLLAFGADLSVERLVDAYSQGIFPWFGEDEPILWWSPNPRGILPIKEFKPSRSLAKLARQARYQISVNLAFDEMIDACATVPRADNGTWITHSMVNAYKALHKAGYAHSVEVWQQQSLVAGLYGVAIGAVFCGESMFHQQTNCSKLAFYHLVRLLSSTGAEFIDCQMQNPHLASLGCIEITRGEFLARLDKQRQLSLPPDFWNPRWLVS